MIGTCLSAMLDGIEGCLVRVEADVSPGIPQFSIVGLPDSSVRESKLRIRSALKNSGLDFPHHRITVNLSPASIRKHGAGLDLPIAIAILRASRQVPPEVGMNLGFCAELGLSGDMIPAEAMVNLTLGLRNAGVHHIVGSHAVPWKVSVPNVSWYLFGTLRDVVEALRHPDERLVAHRFPQDALQRVDPFDMREVMGHEYVKRCLLISAIGRHHLLMVGPPGSGKTMLAERYGSILPPLSELDMLHVYAIHQAAGLNTPPSLAPPVRAPHHSQTVAGMIGGTTQLVPGEVTLAHHGVLFVDELLEFSRPTLEALREPLTSKHVRLHRAGRAVTFPADFQLLGTLNPCPCGFLGFGACQCRDMDITRYWSHLSGALSDRVDMTIPVRQASNRIQVEDGSLDTLTLRERVRRARAFRQAHLAQDALGDVRTGAIRPEAVHLLRKAAEAWAWSHRGARSILSVALSICALEEEECVRVEHMEEAISLRGQTLPSKALRT